MSKPFEVDYTSYPASPNDYVHEDTVKNKICIHHTAGKTGDGAITALHAEDYIMVHFMIDEVGKIFQFLPLKKWAYHLGVKNVPKGSLDRVTVGIEVVNVGPLVLRNNGRLCFWPREFNAQYCTTSDTELYYQVPKWRDYEYFATYNSAQYDSLGKLVGWLCNTLSIPTTILNTSFTLDLEKFKTFSGVVSHHHCRLDKTDTSPAFSWGYFENLLTIAHEYYKEHSGEYDDPLI